MSDLVRRVERLEAVIRPPGCGVCHAWTATAFSIERVTAAGPIAEPPRPERCPGCGREVPIRLARHLVIVREEALA